MEANSRSERRTVVRWVVRVLVVWCAMFFAAPASAQTMTVSPTSLSFSSTPQGSSSTAKTVTVKNTGNTTLNISGVTITGTHAGSFAFTKTCGTSLGKGSSCTVSVTFKPQAQSTLTATLNIATNSTSAPGGLFAVGLTGIGAAPVAVLSVSPTSLTFGNVGLNTTGGPRSVTVTNTGLGTLTFTQAQAISTQTSGAGFAVSSQCSGSLAQGQSCVVGVTFTPTTTGSKTGTLRIYTNVSSSGFAVSLSGTGTTPTPVLTLTPTKATLTCSTPYGGPVTTLIVASNTGTASLNLGAITFTGTGAAWFSQTNYCPLTLIPGAACNIAVTFSPTGQTTRTATMTVASTTAGVASKSVSLTGSCKSHPSP